MLRFLLLCATAVAFLWIGAPRAAAGDLNPPAGLVVPTMKTLDQVEPRIPLTQLTAPGDADSIFKITQPGSYYLTGNLNGASGKHGIEIATTAVTVDLGGYTLFGATGSLNGVHISAVTPDITVRNGVLQSWRGDGVFVDPGARPVRLENLNITLCAGAGIRAGDVIRISDCIVSICQVGIVAGDSSRIERCTVFVTLGGDGIRVGDDGVIIDCSTTSCGATGFVAGIGCIIRDSVAEGNFAGFLVGEESSLSGCIARGNATGISASFSTIVNCVASDNSGSGMSASRSTITACRAFNNGGNGIVATASSVISDCIARNNDLNGFSVGQSLIQSCVAAFNGEDGVISVGDSQIVGNHASFNGQAGPTGAGIYLGLGGNRVEDNVLLDNDRGLWADAAGNFIVRNTASGNSINYVIDANNKVGVIVNAPNSAAISGSTGGAGVGTTDPWANFSY